MVKMICQRDNVYLQHSLYFFIVQAQVFLWTESVNLFQQAFYGEIFDIWP